MTLALIDGDLIAYRVASACQRDSTGFTTETPCEPWFNEHEVLDGIIETTKSWTEAAGCDETLVLLTGSGNFRKTVCPTYKGNRKATVKPVALGFARQCMADTFTTRQVDGLEADDLIGLYLTSPLGRDAVAVSLDKDMRTLEGAHMNPSKDRYVVKVSAREADYNWMMQTLTGDSTDGYGGCPGIGPKKAEAALKGKWTLHDLWAAVKGVYETRKAVPSLALTTARLARILRAGDYDKKTQEVLLWTPNSKTPDRIGLGPVVV